MDSSNNAYSIRLALLEMAKGLLMEKYYGQRIAKEAEFNRQISMIKNEHQDISYPELPEVPTVDDIVRLASSLNEFVSNKKA